MSDKAAESDVAQLINDVQALKRDLAALAEHSRDTAAGTAGALGDEAQRLYSAAAKQGQRQVKALES